MKVRRFLPWASAVLAVAALLTAALTASAAPGKSGATTVRTAVVTDIGGLNDKGFNHLSYVGLQRAQNQLDVQGRAYVTGMTQATDFPVTTCGSPNAPSSDGFIMVLDSAGSGPAFSTYLGGGGYETVNAIAVDALGTAYVTGNTDSANFPNPGAYQPTLGGSSPGSYFMDAFVTKLAPTCP